MHIGPYRLLRRLGEGGMGEVWLGRRDDGLYDGEVAIKTLHPYFAGGALRERFLREAQLLGRLTHPNIARLLDAGLSADGSVYLVLEYVRGVSIDTWCDDHELDVEARLKLFLDVCNAVSHAHANLIVHRDLKPSNILVTHEGQVKLLDFGVAKLVESEPMTHRTDLTRMTGRIFTPEYAAPEQILDQPITTATDVYSLGVLLHVLLTANRPYISGSSTVEIERAVVHDEPMRPSRAVAGASDATRIATARSTTIARLRRALSGDLDNIVTHALRKSPLERYPTVLALAEDVWRHLRHEPILARQENLAARSRKFVRRHRAGIAASALIALVLLAGIAGVIWQAQVARMEARKAGAIRDFLIGIFERNSVSHPDGARARQVTAEELLAQGANEIRTGLADAPEIRAELLGVIGRLYGALEMQKDALPLLQERLALQRRLLGDAHPAVARTLSDLASSQLQSGDYPGAERSATESLDIFRAHGDESVLEYAVAHVTLAQVSYRLGKAQDGRMRRYLETARDLLAIHHSRSSWRLEVQSALSRVAQSEGDHAAALKYDQVAVQLFETGAVDSHGIARGGVYQSLGNGLNWMWRNDEAERYLRKAIVEFDGAVGADHPLAIDGRRELGSFLGWIGRREDSKDTLEGALQSQIRRRGEDDPQLTSIIRLDLGRVLMMRGEYAEAERQLQHVIRTWKISGQPINAPTMHLARIHTEQGRFDVVMQELEDIEAKAVSHFGKGSWWHSVSINRLGALDLARGRLQDAERLFTRTRDEGFDRPGEFGPNRAYAEVGLLRIELLQRADAEALQRAPTLLSQIESSRARSDMPDEEAAANMLLGVALLRAGKVQEAGAHLQKAVAIRERMDAPESLLLAETRLHLAQQQHRAGERANARALTQQATTAFQMQPYVGPQYRELLSETRRMIST
ncbi:serine/threonine-protein kinase [Peristeroidobacter agariperforans]|uniref:serine/threonine-protein kinase n=1 Tax=Peristeroidobacter agariperforans TaxID=268404 RepID=UPI00101BD0BF|nr:serine/threonine-protein kinase [Peristeroidobacter agariperforans]